MSRWLRAAVATALAIAPLRGWAQTPAAPAARDAAMRQLEEPKGLGGCIYIALPVNIRRDTLIRAVAGEGVVSPELKSAVSKVSPKCSGRPYSDGDHALVGSVVAAFQRAAAALGLTQFGVGQPALEASWRGAAPEEKAAFYAMADQFFAPGATVTPRSLDVAPLARRAGIEAVTDPQAVRFLRMYFGSTALIERAEALQTAGGMR